TKFELVINLKTAKSQAHRRCKLLPTGCLSSPPAPQCTNVANGTKLTYRYAYPLVRFRGEADIHDRVASPDLVAYDPKRTSPRCSRVVLECPMTAKRRFQLVLIKPSHYDDDGYVIRWWRAMIPSNSLAAVYGIAADCAERQVLGPDVAIDIEVIDETNTRIDVPTLLARFRSHRNFGLVALTGVQSNQYPRALDIARPFREAGIQVAL